MNWKFNLEGITESYISTINYEIKKTNYKGPVSVILGGNSNYVDLNNLDVYKNVFPNINLDRDIHVFKNCGHWYIIFYSVF